VPSREEKIVNPIGYIYVSDAIHDPARNEHGQHNRPPGSVTELGRVQEKVKALAKKAFSRL
jgi:hypothetical protein